MHEQMRRLYDAAKLMKGISGQSALARALNESPQVVKNWETRGVSKQGMINAEALIGCSALWIKTGRGSMPVKANTEPGPAIRSWVPLIDMVQAGGFCGIADPYPPGTGSESIPTTAKVGPNAYALRVQGDSMVDPNTGEGFPDGAVIIVDPDCEAVNNSYVIVRLDNDNTATFKQLVIDGNRRYLKPRNPRYPIIEITVPATICGVVKKMQLDVDF